jgi:pimeloyl-ACP methyl ester carboxylesterase
LIHGSYQGGWIWQRVASRLRGAGHMVYAPTFDGCAERKHQVRTGITTETHAAEIAETLFYEDLNHVVMVGTSAGGMVLCRAAEVARDRIARVVFVDALALFDGERIRDIVQRSTAVPRGLTAGPSREDAETRLFADLDPATRAWALARYTPHPIGIYEHPVRLQSFWRPAMGRNGDLVPSRREPRRGASAPDRRATQGKVVRARHRPLSDAQLARRADRAADRVALGFPVT